MWFEIFNLFSFKQKFVRAPFDAGPIKMSTDEQLNHYFAKNNFNLLIVKVIFEKEGFVFCVWLFGLLETFEPLGPGVETGREKKAHQSSQNKR